VLHPYIIPVSLGVLAALFLFESHGTHAVGMFFGPVMLVWFFSLAASGLINIVQHPAILAALNPLHGLLFVSTHGVASFVVLGSVLLAFTGAEALYADMGHFGKRPIRIAWFRLVFPALSLNYFGQGGVLLSDSHNLANPFYLLFPHWALYPMVALATLATVIASQATVSGAYSLTKQAVQLRLMPRFNVAHTSEKEAGQVYLPAINWILLALVSATVLAFGSSSHLASAYGLSVTGTMLVTTFLMFFVFRFVWGKGLLLSLLVCGFFSLIDLAFFSSSLLKIFNGAWFPLALGAIAFIIMRNWWHGRQILMRRVRNIGISFEDFVRSLDQGMPVRVSGTAIYLSADPDKAPDALLHNLKHNKILHNRVICLHVDLMEIPWVPASERMSVKSFGHDCWHIVIHFGFKEQPDILKVFIEQGPEHGLDFDILQTTFFLSRITLVPVANRSDGMALWRERMFAAMARNMFSAVEYFNIPANRAIELGTRIEL
jgi:KUP system potassium uptake protein